MMWSRTLSVFGGSFADNVKPKDNTAVNVKDKDKIKDVSGKANLNADGKGKEKLKEKSRTSKLNSVSPSLNDGDGENDDSNLTLKPKSKSKSADLFGTLKRKTSQRKKKKSKTLAPPSSPSDSAFELTSDPSKENTPPGERANDEELQEVVILSNSIPSPIRNAVSELSPIFESSVEETSQAENEENPKSNPDELNTAISSCKEMVKSEVKPRKIKKSKENSEDEEIREISFFYSEEDERFAVKPKKNPMAILLGIDSLIKLTKYFSDPDNLDDEGQLPWNSFEFVLNASVGKECENPNLKSPDLVKFFNKFGHLLTRVRFNFSMFDYDVSLIDDEEKEEENPDQEINLNLNSNPANGMQLEEFFKLLHEKLPNLETLSLSGLPNCWRNLKTEDMSSLKFELVELETLILEKYENYSKHKEILSLLLKSAPNLSSLHNFQLVLLDTFKDEGKLHVIKDIELVHPTFLSQSIWMVEDYFEILRKFTDLVSGQEIKLDHLLVIPDEGFINSDGEVNAQFSELYTKILEGSKDTLKTWSIYPLVTSALPVMPSSGSSSSSQPWSMTSLTTLKLYEFDLCQKGVFKQGTIFKDTRDFTKDNEELTSPSKNKGQSQDPAAISATDLNMDFSTIFPKLTKVELAASKFFQKYDHSLSKNSSVSLKFPTVTELDLNLGSSRPSVGAPFLYNLFDLFRELSKTFPNVIHLKIRCYQKIRYVLRALSTASPGFKDMKSLYIQAIEVDDFITEFRRRDPDEEEDRMIMTRNKNKSRGNPARNSNNNNNNRNRNSPTTSNSNKKSGRGREAALINAFLDIILEENEEADMIQIDMDKIRIASEKKQGQQGQQQRGHGHRQRQRQKQEQVKGPWPLSGLLGLDHLTVGMASHDLDHEPYFEGFRLQGPFNFNLLQVARIKDNMDLDKLDLEILGQSLTESELMELYDDDDGESDSDFDYERYFGLGFGTDYFCPFEGVDPYEVYQKELERKMDFAMFMNGGGF